MKFLAPSKDFTPSPEAVRARLGGGAPAGASARAATVATAAGTAAGSGPRFSSGEAPGASSREDGAALDERRCLGTNNITRERRGRADDVGLGARRRRGFPPAARDDESGMPTKNPRRNCRQPTTAPRRDGGGRWTTRTRARRMREVLSGTFRRAPTACRAQRRSAAFRKRVGSAKPRCAQLSARGRVKTIQNHAPRSEKNASRGEPQFRETIRMWIEDVTEKNANRSARSKELRPSSTPCRRRGAGREVRATLRPRRLDLVREFPRVTSRHATSVRARSVDAFPPRARRPAASKRSQSRVTPAWI